MIMERAQGQSWSAELEEEGTVRCVFSLLPCSLLLRAPHTISFASVQRGADFADPFVACCCTFSFPSLSP
jgi:hypothetical protein